MIRIYTKEELPLLAGILKNDGVISVPTDTVYGVCARMFSPAAQENLRKVKNRPLTKAFPVMCADLEQIRTIAEIDERTCRIICTFMPGPLTVIVRKKAGVPGFVNGDMDTLAVRMAPDETIRELIRLTGEPLYMTSANQSGEKTCTNLQEIAENCPLLDGMLEGETRFGTASTIVDCTGELKILREGPITFEKLKQAADQ
ncbi:MAG: threonylcarbamoyl-AMP synthase [Solobacterium sp.]|nr:threonylcarbamoyl-AMP synthase [Solobacterium sp.]